MGSSGSGSRAIRLSLSTVIRTFLPGLSPIFLRISAGITTWPLARVLTIGIWFTLQAKGLTSREKYNGTRLMSTGDREPYSALQDLECYLRISSHCSFHMSPIQLSEGREKQA